MSEAESEQCNVQMQQKVLQFDTRAQGVNPSLHRSLSLSLSGEQNVLTKTTERAREIKGNIQANEHKQTKEMEEQFLYLHGWRRLARQNLNACGGLRPR